MSTSEPSTSLGADTLPGPAASIASTMLAPVRATAFWSAVMLPLIYLPLVATGLVWNRPMAFGALLVLNAVAFLVGHGHEPQRA